MNKIRFIIAVVLACSSLMVQAQEYDYTPDPSYTDGKKHKEFIMNVTPLVAQLVPFNASTLANLNLFDYQYRKLKNGKGLRWGLGVNLNNGFNVDDPVFLYLRFGYTKRKQVSEHFHVSRSFDINLLADDINGNNRRGKADFNGFAFSYSVGLEYSFTKNIAISTEGSLLFGIEPDSGAKVRFVPPVGLFFHVKL